MEPNFYQEELLDHYRHPRNCGLLEHAQFSTHMLNPSCGDHISMQAHVKDHIMADIRFQGKGCVISQASASLLTEASVGKSLSVLEAFTKDDMLSLVKIPLGPTRLRCALLSLDALKELIKLYKTENQHA